MNKNFTRFIVLTLLFISLQSNAQVTYTGNITLETQTAVDTFLNASHPYTYIDGNLTIGSFGSQIHDLTPLMGIDSISGYFQLQRMPNVTSLAGLDSIKKVGGFCTIFEMGGIENLEGLSNLEYIGGNFNVKRTNSIKTIDGIENLAYVGADIQLGHESNSYWGNDLLEDYCAISDLIIQKFQEGKCTINMNFYNPTLLDFQNGDCSPPPSNDIYFGDITFSTQTAIDTFRNEPHTFHKIVGNVTIDNNTGVDHINNLNGLIGIDSIEAGELYISNQYNINQQFCLTSFTGLNTIKYVESDFRIYYCKFLQNLSGLENLKYIGADLRITGCKTIKSLDGLENLESVIDEVKIGNLHSGSNDSLMDFCAISDLLIQKYQEGKCYILNNAYNPTLQDLQNGDCSQAPNTAPIANAGEDFAANDIEIVQLDASASTDPENAPLTFAWLAPDNISLNDSTLVNPQFTAPDVTTNTTLEFIVFVSDGELEDSDTVFVTITDNYPTLTISSIGSQHLTCFESNDGSLTINIEGGSGDIEYSIDNGNIWQTSNTFENMPAGDYTSFAARDSVMQCSTSNITVTIGQPDELVFDNISVNNDNGSGNGSIEITAEGGTGTINYSADNGQTWQNENTFNNLAAGTYDLAIKDENNCTSYDQVTVENDYEPISINDVTIENIDGCFGDETGSISIDANFGLGDLQYSIDNGTTWQASNVFENLTASEYSIQVKDDINIVDYYNNPATITQPEELVIQNILTSNDNGSSNGTIEIIALGGTGATQYSIDNGNVFQASEIFENLTAGNYYILIKDENECITESEDNPIVIDLLAILENNNSKQQTSVFPNPSKDVIYIKTYNKVTHMDIYNAMGNMAKQQVVGSSDKIDISDLTTGVYFIKLYNNETIVETIKIIKQF